MSGDDPYASPAAAVIDPDAPGNRLRWKRIAGWGASICATMTLIYVLGGFLDIALKLYGLPVDEMAVTLASFVLYLIFLHTTPHRPFLQLMCVFLVVQILGIAVGGAFGLLLMVVIDEPLDDLISFVELGRNLAACLLAYAVWYVTSRKRA